LKTVAAAAAANAGDPKAAVILGQLLLISGKAVAARDVFENALLSIADCLPAFAALLASFFAVGQLAEARERLEFMEAVGGAVCAATLKAHFARLTRLPEEEGLSMP
jgi:hypothetical protein